MSATAEPQVTPKPPAVDPPPSSDVSIGYMEAIRFPFQGPNAWMNILLISVGNMIPVIGPIVVLGFVRSAPLLVEQLGVGVAQQ